VTSSGMEMRPRNAPLSRKSQQHGPSSAKRAINLETLSRFMPREIGACVSLSVCVCLCVPGGGFVAVGGVRLTVRSVSADAVRM